MKVKKITIERLAEMINNGFEKTATKEQFEKIDDRLKYVEAKVIAIGDRLKNVEAKLETIEDLRPRVKILEALNYETPVLEDFSRLFSQFLPQIRYNFHP